MDSSDTGLADKSESKNILCAGFGEDSSATPRKRRQKSNGAAGKTPKSEPKKRDKQDLALVRECRRENPFQFARMKRKVVYERIAATLNKTRIWTRPVIYRYVQTRLDTLVDKWESCDRQEGKVTGGGSVPEPTEMENLLKELSDERAKGFDIASAESSKKEEDVFLIEQIQKKATQFMRQKRSVNEDSGKKTLQKWSIDRFRFTLLLADWLVDWTTVGLSLQRISWSIDWLTSENSSLIDLCIFCGSHILHFDHVCVVN